MSNLASGIPWMLLVAETYYRMSRTINYTLANWSFLLPIIKQKFPCVTESLSEEYVPTFVSEEGFKCIVRNHHALISLLYTEMQNRLNVTNGSLRVDPALGARLRINGTYDYALQNRVGTLLELASSQCIDFNGGTATIDANGLLAIAAKIDTFLNGEYTADTTDLFSRLVFRPEHIANMDSRLIRMKDGVTRRNALLRMISDARDMLGVAIILYMLTTGCTRSDLDGVVASLRADGCDDIVFDRRIGNVTVAAMFLGAYEPSSLFDMRTDDRIRSKMRNNYEPGALSSETYRYVNAYFRHGK